MVEMQKLEDIVLVIKNIAINIYYVQVQNHYPDFGEFCISDKMAISPEN